MVYVSIIDDVLLMDDPLPMYPYMNVLSKAWLGVLDSNDENDLLSYALKWCVVNRRICIVIFKGLLPQYYVDCHYVILLTNVHTITSHAYL